MHRGFGGTAFEPMEEQRDRELTVGPTGLVAIVVGLFALCAVCFVLGYAVGHRGSGTSQAAIVPSVTGGQPAVTPTISQSKPSATQNSFQPQQQAVADASATGAVEAAQPETIESVDTPSAAPAPAEPAVHTALATPPTAVQPVPGAGLKVEPALPQAPAILVQIAAVSHPEDAEVLVGALRKRGYAVTVRRDPTDGLMHVQIGPFASRADATAMRLKLLNDGYNAIIQP